ncbi:MAG: lamin tail domain-containing protein, partial [Verrucomicrobia bacterium]|nr:lamin tail domain-containing protein [Verrucomicrobiota bacterium]
RFSIDAQPEVIQPRARIAEFFLQDDSGGLAVLWRGADAGALPAVGSRVEVIGPVRQANGLLQITPSAGEVAHAVRLLESEVPLPEPVVLDWDWLGDPIRMESLEGRLVRVPGVTLDISTPLFPDRGTSLTLRSVLTGDSLTLRVDGSSSASRVDLAGQPKPEGAFSVTGVWTQNDSSKPHTQGYQILPTRYADLVLDGRSPSAEWQGFLENLTRRGDALTNTFPDQVLRPGESFRILADFSDDQGPIAPGAAVSGPEGTQVIWSEGSVTPEGIHHRGVEVVFTASEVHAGGVHRLMLSAVGVEAERRLSWTVSVPTVEERQIFMTEFLANPTAATGGPSFNPLHRLDWPPELEEALAGRLTAWDEFVELVNVGLAPVSLAGWTVSDATRARAWVDPDCPAAMVPAGEALVLYGGPADSHPPRLPCPALPAILQGGAPAGSDGLGLNNTSDRIELRNGAGHLIERVVYASRDLASAASVARWPLPAGEWSVHPATSDGATTTAGLDVHGVVWSETLQPKTLRLQARRDGGRLRLEWSALTESSYTVWRSVDSGRTWAPLVDDLDHAFVDLDEPGSPLWFRVTSP